MRGSRGALREQERPAGREKPSSHGLGALEAGGAGLGTDCWFSEAKKDFISSSGLKQHPSSLTCPCPPCLLTSHSGSCLGVTTFPHAKVTHGTNASSTSPRLPALGEWAGHV